MIFSQYRESKFPHGYPNNIWNPFSKSSLEVFFLIYHTKTSILTGFFATLFFLVSGNNSHILLTVSDSSDLTFFKLKYCKYRCEHANRFQRSIVCLLLCVYFQNQEEDFIGQININVEPKRNHN